MGRKKQNKTLSGIDEALKNPVAISIKDGMLTLITAVAACGAGAAVGKHSFYPGAILTVIGIYRKNTYLTAAGIGLAVSNGFQKPGQSTSVQGVDGFDIKQIATEAKDRVGTFFENFKEKLYLSKTASSSTTNGLGEGQEEVTYFVNPYSSKEIDMSAIDRVQEQIAKMQSSGTSGLNEIDREF